MHKLGGTAIVLSWNLTAWLVMVLVFGVHCVYVVQIVVLWSVGLWVSNLQNVESRSNDPEVTCCRRLIALDVFSPPFF